MAETLGTLEAGAREILHAGLGAVRSLDAQLDIIKAQIEAGYADLVQRGASDRSEPAIKLHSLLDQSVAQVRELQGRIDALIKRN
ncbi:MAG: hypothetical protein K1X75_11755 [Leptospirales bacterium]|nr:hypothetical protein [Leptospirales bacterium]